MKTTKKIGIIGAGPGGLAAACLMQSRGHQVTLFEAREDVGGRTSQIRLNTSRGEFKFDTGPTFFLMPQVLGEIFQKSGRSMSDYLDLTRIDPLYLLDFSDGSTLSPRVSARETAAEISKLSPRDGDSFFLFRERQKNKFESILPTLKNSAQSIASLVRVESLSAVPFLNLKSVYDELSDYFEDERVRLAFTFQAKYLGMSPFDCPSLFTILPHIEHDLGVWHPRGGCSSIPGALAKLFVDLGGELKLSTPVQNVVAESGQIQGLKTRDGYFYTFDDYVLGADFAYGMSRLFKNSERKKYNNQKLESLKLSCSTFMVYLGLDRVFENLSHHGVYFSGNYRKNLREIFETFELPEDPSFYLHNPSVLDSTLAPEGCSSLYLLVPVPRLTDNQKFDWKTLQKTYRDKVISLLEKRTGITIRDHIVDERVITPADWESHYNVFKGATFSLAHTPDQLLHNRPHNHSEDFENLFIVGGGTHPGSGLPTIFESARIAADLLEKKYSTLSPKETLENLRKLDFARLPFLQRTKEVAQGIAMSPQAQSLFYKIQNLRKTRDQEIES
jgi:phytoene desaturase